VGEDNLEDLPPQAMAPKPRLKQTRKQRAIENGYERKRVRYVRYVGEEEEGYLKEGTSGTKWMKKESKEESKEEQGREKGRVLGKEQGQERTNLFFSKHSDPNKLFEFVPYYARRLEREKKEAERKSKKATLETEIDAEIEKAGAKKKAWYGMGMSSTLLPSTHHFTLAAPFFLPSVPIFHHVLTGKTGF
jgi:hypothetical protein